MNYETGGYNITLINETQTPAHLVRDGKERVILLWIQFRRNNSVAKDRVMLVEWKKRKRYLINNIMNERGREKRTPLPTLFVGGGYCSSFTTPRRMEEEEVEGDHLYL